ncbi:hypothetical protein DIZ81_05160 [Legionella taurinensis]|uniref:Uncharacterized protein n=1 Tax=Legionella taurinensis TaxID=70611 RepID=A0A3A5L956_9GAMM|nr:hypothetical protein [Legionella taurinensis]MDX1837066.1 hypothetical protein [Legionella taurinensis]PUT41463.1 hypothetical protein DB744_05160 [Legionella taurinensis]PUT42702.1 hypothetical protein DB746_07495 [Legionella taurinensis]PUT46730.1 hypothetical protein DB743_04895 [Legionella taurinensis]PUT47379.1 hypothetical protein DB745_08575 [Legionella taurinensis]
MKFVTRVNKPLILTVGQDALMIRIRNASKQALNELQTYVEEQINEVLLRIKMNSAPENHIEESSVLSALQKIRESIDQEITSRQLNPETSNFGLFN